MKKRAIGMEYDSTAKYSAVINEFTELLRYRDLLFLMVSNGIKRRYKRSTIGVVWTLLNPLFTMGILTLVFSNLFRFAVPNYSVYLLAGIIFWGFFSQSTQDAMNSLVWGSALLKQVYVPRTIFSLAAIGTGLINLLISFIPLGIIMLIMNFTFKQTLFFLPFAILLTAMFTLGLGFILSSMAVFFVDVFYIYQIFLTAWFYLTPIIYPINILPAKYVWYMNLNPLYNLLEMFRGPICFGIIPGRNTILVSSAWAIISLSSGLWVFTKKADEVVYRI